MKCYTVWITYFQSFIAISKYLFKLECQQPPKWVILINSGADNPLPLTQFRSNSIVACFFIRTTYSQSFITNGKYLLEFIVQTTPKIGNFYKLRGRYPTSREPITVKFKLDLYFHVNFIFPKFYKFVWVIAPTTQKFWRTDDGRFTITYCLGIGYELMSCLKTWVALAMSSMQDLSISRLRLYRLSKPIPILFEWPLLCLWNSLSSGMSLASQVEG